MRPTCAVMSGRSARVRCETGSTKRSRSCARGDFSRRDQPLLELGERRRRPAHSRAAATRPSTRLHSTRRRLGLRRQPIAEAFGQRPGEMGRLRVDAASSPAKLVRVRACRSAYFAWPLNSRTALRQRSGRRVGSELQRLHRLHAGQLGDCRAISSCVTGSSTDSSSTASPPGRAAAEVEGADVDARPRRASCRAGR